MNNRRRFCSTAWRRQCIWAVWACLAASGNAHADDVHLQNGMQFSGTAVPIKGLTNALAQRNSGPTNIYPILMVDTGMKRVYLPQRRVVEIVPDAGLSRYERFELKQKRTSGGRTVQMLGGIRGATPFDQFGRRTVTLATPQGPLNIVQGVTTITPEFVTVTGVTALWEHGISTSSIPPADLDAMLRTATDPSSPNDRLAIARFYIQASQYGRAADELTHIANEFPDYQARVNDVRAELRQLQARQLLSELRRRKSAGQHALAYQAARVFPTNEMSVEVLREVRELLEEYDIGRNRRDRALMLLGELPAELQDSELAAAVKPLRSQVVRQLETDFEALQRLDAFLSQADDPARSAEEKLALAYSGWIAGSAHAIDDLQATLRLWNARFQILQILRTKDELRRRELLAELESMEGVGPQTVAHLIPLLPSPVETPEAEAGRTTAIETTAGELDVKYSVLLPTGYPSGGVRPQHRYPLIVALRPAERSIEEILGWWGGTVENPGQAQRHGYIVMAPEYVEADQREYTGSAVARQIIVEAIQDACKRFSVDSDRVFLTGHGMGGNVACDLGMSRPDLFAGVIPITALMPDICKWYVDNAKHLSWYFVSGELDRDTLATNATVLGRMLTHGFDVVCVEFIGRGYESYYAEIHNLFTWMSLQRRVKFLDDVDMRVKRPGDNRFYWLEARGLPPQTGQSTRPLQMKVRVTPGNTIYVTSAADVNTLWLSPEFINFDERVTVRAGGRQKFNDFVRPDLSALLDDLRERGDRELLYPVRLQVE